MADKHIQLKIHTGNGNFDELFPVTKAELVEVNGKKLSESLDDVTAQLAQTKLDFDTAVSGITVDSEVLLTHNSATKNKTFSSLDSRLEEIEADNKLKANKKQEDWITPTLLNGWVVQAAREQVSYMKDEFGFIHLRGNTLNGASGELFTLPADYRPKDGEALFFMCGTSETALSTVAPVTISPSTGVVKVNSSPLPTRLILQVIFRGGV